jgi:DNA topoisomerase-1
MTFSFDAFIATDPPVSEPQRRAMYAALNGKSTIGIPKSVAKKFVGPKAHDAGFNESDHPRGQPKNEGQFVKGSGSKSGGEKLERRVSQMQPALRKGGKLLGTGSKALPKHIASLRIPPAWTNVEYNPDANAALYATGRDEKGRKQCIYSQAHVDKQSAAKFAKMRDLDKKFSGMEKENAKHQQSKNKTVAECADCLALIMATGLRPGSDKDTKADKDAFGASTLQGKHVVEVRGQVRLRFTAKKGVSLDIPVDDPKIATMVKQRAVTAGRTGKLFPVVNEFNLRAHSDSLDGGGFTSKDFRTLMGTRTAMQAMKLMGPPSNVTNYKKQVLAIAKQVAAKLGNTASVALKAYIDPSIFAAWRLQAKV